MPRSKAYPYRWDAWLVSERIATGTAWNMAKAQSLANAYYSANYSALLVMQITTPNGTVYFLTHPGLKWLPNKRLLHVRHSRP